ncbi:RNA polymerase factor sigma-54 [bacterium]|nr:RNA polymerase factor sigma-54 [bacterium]
MEQRLQLQLKLGQRLIMTPRMQQSLHLLQVPTLELSELIQQELAQNCMLEEAPSLEINPEGAERPEIRVSEKSNGSEDGQAAVLEKGSVDLDDNWQSYFEDASDVGPVPPRTYEAPEEDFETPLSSKPTLKDELLRQLGLASRSDRTTEIGEIIIDWINDDGYLSTTVEHLAEHYGYGVEEVAEVLALIQGFDPAGVGARDLAECLSLQYHARGMNDPTLLLAIQKYLPDLEHKRYAQVARALGVTEQKVQAIADELRTFEPRPGHKYGPVETTYVTPDVFIEKVEGEWQVRVNDDGAPPVRVSRRYLQMLANPENLTAAEKQYLSERLSAARWLIHNIEQRKRTLYQVTKQILEMQKDFMEDGVSALRPMRYRDVADAIGVHESTVGRVVNGKYVETPQGLFELKYFFSTGLDSLDGEEQSAKAVMLLIEELIEREDKKKPLSDEKIAAILKEKHNLNLARRTVAKYRDKMGILRASQRKRI